MLNVWLFYRRGLLLFAALLGLSGCVPDNLQTTHYEINGADRMPEVKQYLEKILDERVAENLDYEADSEEFKRMETLREQTIVNDLTRAMKAKGYYDASVVYDDNEDKSLTGTYSVQPGSLYIVSDISVEPELVEKVFDYELMNVGYPLKASDVLAAQQQLYESVQKDKCYFSLHVGHSVVLDRDSKTAALQFNVEAGPQAKLGNVNFVGQKSVRDSFLQKMVPWKNGDCFRREKIRTLQNTLLETGLFARVDEKLSEQPNENDVVDVTIDLKERVHRSVKAGLSYYTDEGAGVTLGWEHRNFRGAGEKLETRFKISQINQSFDTGFVKPFFIRKDQTFEMTTGLRRRDTDAFEENALNLGGNISRKFSKRSSGSVGSELTFSEVTDENGTEEFGLLSFPINVTYDNRDNALDPHKGFYLTGGVEPFYDVLGKSDPFNKLEAGARTYFDLGDTPDLVLALRINAGSIVGGGATSDIPATERFYAGGGGSIRGYGYQNVGPSVGGDPTGGRSVVTGAAELRAKLTTTLGGVAFVDGGSISDSAVPDLDKLSFGAGVGVRYYTDFGPLRFDVAVPLNEKKDLDQNYQFYISIGQAF